jgi:predicted nucleotide-binding protein
MARTVSKLRVFVSTSTEGLKLAYTLQDQLRKSAETVVWTEGFSPGTPTYESLLETLKASDIAVIAFSSDDFARSGASREERENLLFVHGLFVGTLGLDRTFVILPKRAMHFYPADLTTITVLTFDDTRPSLASALAPVSKRIRGVMEKLRPPRPAKPRKQINRKQAKKTGSASRTKSRGSAQVFISYSSKDKKWLEKLRTFLAPSTQDDDIVLWDDTMIKPGDKWKERIESALGAAKVAVLLVSRHFLASRFIREQELPPLLDAAKRGGLRIIWVYVSAADFKRTAIKDYQAAHDITRPLDARNTARQNEELLKVCDRINEAAGAGG